MLDAIEKARVALSADEDVNIRVDQIFEIEEYDRHLTI